MRFIAFLVILLVLAGLTAAGGLYSFNQFETIEREFSGLCAPVSGVAGPEDIQIDYSARRAFISSLDRRASNVRGGIHVFDLNDPLASGGWRDRTGGLPAVFRPLGIDYYEDEDVRRLFVVNEANAAVEMFDIADNGALLHVETFHERRMTSPNNIVAVGRRSFYVTNDVKAGRNSILGNIQFLTRAGTGQVLFTDGAVWRVAAEGLRFANGIDISPEKDRLYVSETAVDTVRIYDRDTETGALILFKTVKLDAAPDNITVDRAGNLWVAALPKPLSLPRLKKNPKALAPSEIIRISADGEPVIVYRDDGAEISASTVATRIGDMLLIGTLYDKKFLICELPAGAN